MHLKMSSAEVVCCKQLPSITDKLSIEANSVDTEQTASSLIWVHTVCHRGFLNVSADEKQTAFVAIGALRGNMQTGRSICMPSLIGNILTSESMLNQRDQY